jgi:hypothetical protein
MRRMKFISLGLLLAIVLVACGGGDDEGGDGGGSNNPAATSPADTQQNNPPANTTAFPTNPPLPPAATIDPNSAGSGNGNNQPTVAATPFPTRGGGGATLPPTWTPASFQGSGQTGNTPAGGTGATTAPGSTPNNGLSTNLTPPTTEPPTIERDPACANFGPDYDLNQPAERHITEAELTIHWFPVESEGIIYLVQLYDVTGRAVYVVEVPETQVTFAAELFPTVGTYSWTVFAYRNGELTGCGVIDDEIFVSS